MPPTSALARFALGPLDVPLKADFRVASAALNTLGNGWLALADGAGRVGFGEVAVLPPITAETQGLVLASEPLLAEVLRGIEPAAIGHWQGRLQDHLAPWPALRAGVEMALLDLLTQAAGISLWSWFGARETRLCTDITIPIVPAGEVAALVRDYVARGFTRFKVKVGADLALDLARVVAVADACPGGMLIVDANGGYTEAAAQGFVKALQARGIQDWVFEQPVARADFAGLARIKAEPGVRVYADESAGSVVDVLALIRADAVHGINLKIAKSGVLQTLAMAELARAAGLELMIGGMVETRLAMNVSAQMAAGLGGFTCCDLDTPLLLQGDPIVGGYTQVGPEIYISTATRGHGALLPLSAHQRWVELVPVNNANA